VTRAYLDTNFLYSHARAGIGETVPGFDGWRELVDMELDPDRGVISALVIDELAYRMILAWLRDDGDADPLSTYRAAAAAVTRSMRPRLDRLWRMIDDLHLEITPTTQGTVTRAKALMADPGLAPRDAFHAAHALGAGCTVIVSLDADYDTVSGLGRLGPLPL
jgi:predicted nucleic acid-binding protein